MKTKAMRSGSAWVFKIKANPIYPDVQGKRYVYDNRHSIRVKPDDRFVYLEKLGREQLRFTGTGQIERVEDRPATKAEQAAGKKLHTIYSACLSNVIVFEKPIVVSPTREGQAIRRVIGLSRNLNDDGLSRSVCRISDVRFARILALGATKTLPSR